MVKQNPTKHQCTFRQPRALVGSRTTKPREELLTTPKLMFELMSEHFFDVE